MNSAVHPVIDTRCVNSVLDYQKVINQTFLFSVDLSTKWLAAKASGQTKGPNKSDNEKCKFRYELTNKKVKGEAPIRGHNSINVI